uniref:Phosphoribosyltransferase domain-containing protein n=1 Tax=Pseudo-nitzschia australis TaxID=44445 RepID=A0A7S4A8T8_9STRA|mmetsp:Transcript_10407/g.22111  ORF Transcript_10407/g.22111 Transcript_10407/m.22111 type:complete len:792 (+) Transcript_10407:85-2460(+)
MESSKLSQGIISSWVGGLPQLCLCLLVLSIAIINDSDAGKGVVFAWTTVATTKLAHSYSRSDWNANINNRNGNGNTINHIRSRENKLHAKKRPNSRDDDDVSNWYDPVDDDATPDQVFFQEMERQRLINQVGGDATTPSVDAIGGGGSSSSTSSSSSSPMTGGTPRSPSALRSKGGSASPRFASASPPMSTFPQLESGPGVINAKTNGLEMPPFRRRNVPTMEQIKIAQATLAEYEAFQVSDNWLNEELQQTMWNNKQRDSSVEQDDENDNVDGKDGEFEDDGKPEPWDDYGKENAYVDYDRRNIMEVPTPEPGSEFYFDPDLPIDPGQVEQEEKELAGKMKEVKTRSIRLEKAKRSPNAIEFFRRKPNEKEGYEHLWVAAVDNVSYMPLIGNLRDYGVEFADNFGDFEDQSANDALLHSIEDMAAWKARQVYKVTGLPTIASRSSFEIEPVVPSSLNNLKDSVSATSTVQAAAASRLSDPRVVSGYKINDIANHVDYLAEAMKPLSEPTRVTRFTSCFCFYDGEKEIFAYGVLDCDMYFCNSQRTNIPLSQATNNLIKTLQMTFGLEYQKFLKTRLDDAIFGDYSLPGAASVKLRDRVLKDGRVLPNNIIDVSKFMDSCVDVDLMDACAQELSQRFVNSKPTKIITVATTGLVIALPMAKYLQVPVVYARKERNVVMADTYSAPYSSKTVGKDRQLLVSKSHVHKSDRVLIIDDFLSSGSSQEALLRILSDAGAEPVGIGVLLEKAYDPGRKALSGFDIPIESLCRVATVDGGVIQLVEEDGFDKMKDDK